MPQSTAVNNENNKPERLDPAAGATYRQLQEITQNLEDLEQHTLNAALIRHGCLERASFHIPGHKGRFCSHLSGSVSQLDLTELPNLDDLTYPTGIIKSLEDRIARLYKVKETILSVSGASSALLSCIISVARPGGKILIPRNAHRAVIHGLVLSGLEPIWYEPKWNKQWGVFEEVQAQELAKYIESAEAADIVAAVVVSPTYAGAISDIDAISRTCSQSKIRIIVDEAHGAHFFPNSEMPRSACELGADLVAHSLHKTFGSLTQTGAVHVNGQSVESESVRAAMRLVSTSSPSYVLLASIENATLFNTSPAGSKRWSEVLDLAQRLRNLLSEYLSVYKPEFGTNPLHMMAAHSEMSAFELAQFLQDRGIFVETILGKGCLFVLGVGTIEEDLQVLHSALKELPPTSNTSKTNPDIPRPPRIEQVVSPRRAHFAAVRAVEPKHAIGMISCDCIAPCPPGVPVVVPGSRITKEIVDLIPDIRSLRVLEEEL